MNTWIDGQTHRQAQRHKQTDRLTDISTDFQKIDSLAGSKQTDRPIDSQKEKNYRQTKTETDEQMDGQIDRWTGRDRNR